MSEDLSGFSMLDLFRTEAEGQLLLLTDGLLVLEQNPSGTDSLESMMRASHSIKGAARMVDIDPVVRIAHVMEDCFVAAQKSELILKSADIDILLNGVDVMGQVSKLDESDLPSWSEQNRATLDALVLALQGILSGEQPQDLAMLAEASTVAVVADEEGQATVVDSPSEHDAVDKGKAAEPPPDKAVSLAEVKGRVLRVSTERMDRLLGLAGEAMVEARWLHPHIEAMQRFKRFQFDLVSELDDLREKFNEVDVKPSVAMALIELQRKAVKQREVLSDRLVDLEHFDYRTANLAGRLHREVLASRMRPFSDGVDGFQRMVRDVARSLGKDARLVITGATTQVDRDVLEMVKAPLNHLLRNAVDHGVEMPEEREASGKPSQAIVTLDARQSRLETV